MGSAWRYLVAVEVGQHSSKGGRARMIYYHLSRGVAFARKGRLTDIEGMEASYRSEMHSRI